MAGSNVPYVVTEDGMFLDVFISHVMKSFEGRPVKAVGFDVKLRGGHTISFGITKQKSKAVVTNK